MAALMTSAVKPFLFACFKKNPFCSFPSRIHAISITDTVQRVSIWAVTLFFVVFGSVLQQTDSKKRLQIPHLESNTRPFCFAYL
uniref:Uncharacterized protein n=1 Tax=Anguilla anguilla TaxID=7936 RepID=A0A0E9PU54_ANGAN